MTEVDWNSSQDPQAMLKFLRDSGKASDRKLRLFALACCSRVREHITAPRSRAAVAFAERHAETGMARERGRPADAQAARAAHKERARRSRDGKDFAAHMIARNAVRVAVACMHRNAWLAAFWAADSAARVTGWRLLAAIPSATLPTWEDAAKRPEQEQQAALLREIFGPLPFRPVTIEPSLLGWHEGLVVRLAQAAYEQRSLPDGGLDASRLAVLADALEEAGCRDEEVLRHLREQDEHWRGCWVLDRLLDKG